MSHKRAWIRSSIGIITLAVALGSGSAEAATMYTNAANVTGIEDGTANAPFTSIQRAIDAAVAGDVVSVAPGIYYENVTLKDLVNVSSQKGPAATVIDGQGGYVIGSWFQPMTVRSTVDGFTIRNGSTLVHGVSSWSDGYTRITVRNSVLRDGGLGVRASIASNFTFENVVFYNTAQAVSSIWCGAPRLKNVTIDRADQAVWSYQNAVELRNTTITNSRVVLSAPFSGYVFGSNNNFFGYENFVDGNVSLALTDSMSAAPLFQNTPDDYRLQPGSPLIDAGIDVGLPYNGAAPDIGAYESLATPADQVNALTVSIRDATPEAFRNPEEQRRHALYQKLMAVLNVLESIKPGSPAADRQGSLKGIAAKLENDILPKADGFFGGDPKNDWIVVQAEQAEFYPRVKQLLETLKADLAGSL